jgi:hypothetical protein
VAARQFGTTFSSRIVNLTFLLYGWEKKKKSGFSSPATTTLQQKWVTYQNVVGVARTCPQIAKLIFPFLIRAPPPTCPHSSCLSSVEAHNNGAVWIEN